MTNLPFVSYELTALRVAEGEGDLISSLGILDIYLENASRYGGRALSHYKNKVRRVQRKVQEVCSNRKSGLDFLCAQALGEQ